MQVYWHPYYLKYCDQSRIAHAVRSNGKSFCGFSPKWGWMGGTSYKDVSSNVCTHCDKLTKKSNDG